MGEPVVVTGAHSVLGSMLCAHLAGQQEPVIGLITPWADSADLAIQTVRADLRKPLPSDVCDLIRRSGQVFHLAWARGAGTRTENIAMIDHLMSCVRAPAHFHLMSSVAAGPRAESEYGKSKWEATQRVRKAGGNVLVCGLVSGDHPKLPFNQLQAAVGRSWLSLELKQPVKVYPISTVQLFEAITGILRAPPPPGCYGLFQKNGPDLNQLLRQIEQGSPRRRWKLTLRQQWIEQVARVLKKLKLPPHSAWERALTLLQKDAALLDDLPQLNGVRPPSR